MWTTTLVPLERCGLKCAGHVKALEFFGGRMKHYLIGLFPTAFAGEAQPLPGRIEFNPDTKSLIVYDSDGERHVIFGGK
jgi:hypothetical protein